MNTLRNVLRGTWTVNRLFSFVAIIAAIGLAGALIAPSDSHAATHHQPTVHLKKEAHQFTTNVSRAWVIREATAEQLGDCLNNGHEWGWMCPRPMWVAPEAYLSQTSAGRGQWLTEGQYLQEIPTLNHWRLIVLRLRYQVNGDLFVINRSYYPFNPNQATTRKPAKASGAPQLQCRFYVFGVGHFCKIVPQPQS